MTDIIPGEEHTEAARIAEMEAELARLRSIEQAAKEARAFMEGRRPGFPPSYPLDVLRAALNAAALETVKLPVSRVVAARRKAAKPNENGEA